MSNLTNLDQGQLAAQEQFDQRSKAYGKSHILADTSDIEEALQGLEIGPGSQALDIATGGGHTAVFLARRGLEVMAADLSGEMLQRTTELAASSNVSVRTQQCPAEKLPDRANSYGLVTCRVAAHHFSQPEAFIHEVARVLEPGGYFILIDGSVPDGEPVAEEWIHQVEKLRDPSHRRFLTPGAWSNLARQAGLNVLRDYLHPFKQPDLQWYFATAATSSENQSAVLRLIDSAPAEARRVFRLGVEEGKVVWWWSRLTLVAQKPAA
jgi:ubiquinone/menaquinone biosynthesis C-methylase UbiE